MNKTDRLKIQPRLKLASPMPVETPAVVPVETAVPIAKTKVQHKVQVKVHTNQPSIISPTIRRRALDIFVRKFSNVFSTAELESLEEATYVAAIECMSRYNISDSDTRVTNRYNMSVQSICLNLDPESPARNGYLLPAILEGRVKLADVPSMTPMEINPKDWAKQIINKVAETQLLVEGPTNIVTTTLIKCGRCKSGVRYQEVQRRSADEAMTIEAECIKCGNRFNI